MLIKQSFSDQKITKTIVICTLGYFIDVLDIQLFAVLRRPSLTELGFSGAELSTIAGHILNTQMLGMVLGAFLWGWLGDRFGRMKALYGSILIYSVGTMACGFVQHTDLYALLRFITGFGLAGETGAAIAITTEIMPRDKRGWGIATVAGIGFFGPVMAVLLSKILPWRMTYEIAGILGLILFAIRYHLTEPALYRKICDEKIMRGSLQLLKGPTQRRAFICCLILGLSCVYPWNILNFFSAELGKTILGPDSSFEPSTNMLLFFLGTSLGDFLSGIISQLRRKRRATFLLFLLTNTAVTLFYLLAAPHLHISVSASYLISFLIGVSAGNWVLFMTISAEHFGTNIRATTSILIVNIARGFTIPLVLSFQNLSRLLPINETAALMCGLICIAALWALSRLKETHGIELDYVEEIS